MTRKIHSSGLRATRRVTQAIAAVLVFCGLSLHGAADPGTPEKQAGPEAEIRLARVQNASWGAVEVTGSVFYRALGAAQGGGIEIAGGGNENAGGGNENAAGGSDNAGGGKGNAGGGKGKAGGGGRPK